MMSNINNYLENIDSETANIMSDEFKSYFNELVKNDEVNNISARQFSEKITKIFSQYDPSIEYVKLVDQNMESEINNFITMLYTLKIVYYSGEVFYLNAYTKIMEKHILN